MATAATAATTGTVYGMQVPQLQILARSMGIDPYPRGPDGSRSYLRKDNLVSAIAQHMSQDLTCISCQGPCLPARHEFTINSHPSHDSLARATSFKKQGASLILFTKI